MYLEKKYLIDKIDEWANIRGYELSYGEKEILSSKISKQFDQDRIVSFEEFSELLDHNNQLEQYENIEFNDEIVSIEEIGIFETIDFNVTGDHLFFSDGILTHNSAQNSDDADNQAVSDSIGTLMTADFMLFLLQNEEMKQKNEIVCKCTKNRFTGRTDTWMMNIDYEKMRFYDMILKTPEEMIDAADFIAISDDSSGAIDDDFGIITKEKQEKAEIFAKQEVNDIISKDIQRIKDFDNKSESTKEKDPMKSELDDIYKELGL